MSSNRNFLWKNIFAFFVSLVLIFTACEQPSGGGNSPRPSSPSSTSTPDSPSDDGTPKIVTLTFDLEGGNIDGKTKNVTLTGTSGTALVMPRPIKNGYDLSGWKPAVPAKFPSSNMTYKAQWEKRKPDEISLMLDLHGGTGIKPFIKGKENSAVTLPQNPTRRGYNFQKWEPKLPSTFTKQASTKEYVAVWKPKSVTYTLYLDEAKTSVYKTLTGDHDTNVTRPDSPPPEGREYFDYWKPELPETFDVDKPTKYVAIRKHVPNDNVVLTLELDGGILPAGQDEHPHGKEGDALSVQNPTKKGYTFTGWNTTGGNLPTAFPPSDATYTAQWQVKTYAVKYNSNGGGTAPTDTSRTYGQPFTLATSAGMGKTGHDFAGWEKDNAGTAYGSGVTITDTALTQTDDVITFWAEWTPLTYSVTYNTNGATSGQPSKTTDTHIYGREYTLAAQNDLKKTGYTLKGWTTTSDGSGTVYAAGETTSDEEIKKRTSDITFYAKWEVTTMSLDKAIVAIRALGAGETLNVVLDSSTTQTFFASEVRHLLQNCKGKVNLDMSKTGVTSIPNSAFDNCTSLVSVVIPDSVTSIEDSAFKECTSLASVNIPDGVTSIGINAFWGCPFTNVNIPDSVTRIGIRAFTDTSLTSVVIPSSVTSIDEHAFSGTPLTSVVIPDGVARIKYNAFGGCTSLVSVVIPNSVTTIEESVFRGCTSLTSVVMPDSVTTIEERAFQDCSSLATINYAGTKNDWNTKITSFGHYWKEYIPAKGVTCRDGVTYKFVGNSSWAIDSELGDPL